MRSIIFSFLLLASGAAADEATVYFDSQRSGWDSRTLEIRVFTGVDFSDPYYFYWFGGPALYIHTNSWLALGGEFRAIQPIKRYAGSVLTDELAKYGFTVNIIRPTWSTVGVVRITPLSGMVNWFSRSVLFADVSILGRGGMFHQSGAGLAPLFGIGLEFMVGLSPSLGLFSNIIWDVEKPKGTSWQSQSSFQLGPVFRF